MRAGRLFDAVVFHVNDGTMPGDLAARAFKYLPFHALDVDLEQAKGGELHGVERMMATSSPSVMFSRETPPKLLSGA